MTTNSLHAFVTIAARPEWALARVVAESFLRYHPDIPFFVLLAENPGNAIRPRDEPFHVLMPDDLALDSYAGLTTKLTRQELTYALTPDAIRHLHRRGYRHVGFVKQESMFTGPIHHIMAQLEACSILLTPHLPRPLNGPDAFAREANILQSGIYNVGYLGVSDTDEGRRFLGWWSDRCHAACTWDVPNGYHFEQRWLDLVPGYFGDVDRVRDRGFNLAHWNLPEMDIHEANGSFLHPEGACSFFRFSGYDYDHAERTSRYRVDQTLDKIGGAARVFEQYHEALKRNGHEIYRA